MAASPLSKAQVRKLVDDAWAAVLRYCAQSPLSVERIVAEGVRAAEEGERQHRKGWAGRPSVRGLESVSVTARWFVMKWAAERLFGEPRKATTYLEAASLRADALAGYALGDALLSPMNDKHCGAQATAAIDALQLLLVLDYSEHFIGERS